MIYFGIDYGDTVGFSIVDETGSLTLIGSSKDPKYCIEQLEQALNYYSELTVVIERQIGVKVERYTNFVEKINLLASIPINGCTILEILPHVWKNSFVNKIKIKPTNHAIDSAKIALYGAFKNQEK